MPGAMTKLIDGAGHSPAVEAPEKTAGMILDFAGAGSAGSAGKGKRGRAGAG